MSMLKWYKLTPEKDVVECTAEEWGNYFQKPDRIIRQDTVRGVWLSTVFLGLHHNYTNEGPPLLFETMAFSDKKKEFNFFGRKRMYRPERGTWRWPTWQEAYAGHMVLMREYQTGVCPECKGDVVWKNRYRRRCGCAEDR